MWHSPTGDWELKRFGNRQYSLVGNNPPVAFQFPGPMSPPSVGPCPTPAIGWGLGETPAGGSWTVLVAACNQECNEYDPSYDISAHIKAMYASGLFEPPYDTLLFEGDFSGTLSKVQSPVPSIHYHTGCVWQGSLTASNLTGMAPYAPTAIMSRDECGWWLEMGGGYGSTRCYAVNRCSNTSHDICDSPIGAFANYETPCGLTAPVNYMWVSNIRVTGTGAAPAMASGTAAISATATPTAIWTPPDNAASLCATCPANGSCPNYCVTCGGKFTVVGPCPVGRW